jgi:hypothetical protein
VTYQVSSTGKKRRTRSRGSWRGERLLRVASDAAGGDQSGSKLARAPLAGARGEQGAVSSAAAGRGARRGRRQQLEVAEAEVAAGARAATAEEVAVGLERAWRRLGAGGAVTYSVQPSRFSH